MQLRVQKVVRMFSLLLFTFLVSSCSVVMTSATNKMADQLSYAIVSSNDIETVRDGMPAYMLLLDGIIQDDPENQQTLLSAAKLYSSYASIFVNDAKRQKKMAWRSFDYSLRAACLSDNKYCHLVGKTFDAFSQIITNANASELNILFSVGSSWAGYIQAASDDWLVVANLPKVQLLMEQIVKINPLYGKGDAHYYLGIIYSLIPPALGGKPSKALNYLTQADELSEHKNLMIQVTMAERYARVIFDRKLHDQLLNQVIENTNDYPNYRLLNTLAKEKAASLLNSANDFF